MVMWMSIAGSFGVLGFLYCMFSYKSWRRINIKNKVVLITGANSGLGKACASVFYQAGCRVILAGRNLKQLEEVQKELTALKLEGQHPPSVILIDLEDMNSFSTKAVEVIEVYGQIDILVNNAGISHRGKIQDTLLDVDMKLMRVNYFGQVGLIKALLPYMVNNGGGHIVIVSSLQGKLSVPYRSAYSASKHAFQAFGDCLRAEMADSNIAVSVLSPGYMQTNLSLNAVCGDGSKHGIMDKTTATGMAPEYVARKLVDMVHYQQADVCLAPLLHRIAILIRTLLPSLFFKLMRARARKQRDDYNKDK